MSSGQNAAKTGGTGRPRGRPPGSKNRSSAGGDSAKKPAVKARLPSASTKNASNKAGAGRGIASEPNDVYDLEMDDFEAEVEEPEAEAEPEVQEQEVEEEEEDPQRKTIPPLLLTRILHEFFERDSTRITKDANLAVAKYMDVFVREAIARAAVERDGGFFEVEDLEKIAPQLLLDL